MRADRFAGPWQAQFEGYLAYRDACGWKRSDAHDYLLGTLCDHLVGLGEPPGTLTEGAVRSYLSLYDGKAASTVRGRECMVRQFAAYLRTAGHDAWVLPVASLTRERTDFVPYIFSHDEMAGIFRACDGARGRGEPSARSRLFYQTLFRLLYSTGMRLGEALSLGVDDVDLKSDVVTVLDGKGGVSRLVPFHASLHPWMERWDAYRREHGGGDHFFESGHGGTVCQPCVFVRFTKVVLPSAGIVPSEGQRINVHSLRHTFACHALDAMAKAGMDTRVTLPYLSAYMGHKDIKSTEIYLRLTEERFGEIVSATHHIYEGVL